MQIEDRLHRLEVANRRLTRFALLVTVALVSIPLMSALQQDKAKPAEQNVSDNLVLEGKDGWKLVLGTRDGKRGGFGVFLLDKAGVARGRLVVEGTAPRIDVCNAKAEHGAALEAESDKTSAMGIWSGEHWRLRSEIKFGRPISGVYDELGKQRLRYGIYKGDSYMTLVDDDGETDRAWMMVESTGRSSIAARGAKRAEASLNAGFNQPVGVSIRDTKGRMRALMYTHEDASYVVAYDKNEMSRAVLEAPGKGVVGVKVTDADNKDRIEVGVDADAGARVRLLDGKGSVVGEIPGK